VEAATLRGASVRVGGTTLPLEVDSNDGMWTLGGSVEFPDAALWWPATHGAPTLHECEVQILTSVGSVVLEGGPVGFRDLQLDRRNGRIQFVVNGVPIFCRGSCWTTNDIVSLVGSPEGMRNTLRLVADANANMIRVGGTMVYESDDFYRSCDELGLMVWQDFMFANMDYPVDDAAFAESARAEAEQQLRRLARHPSVVAFCGGSEVEQQAAMFGAPREIWSNDLFSSTLPRLVEMCAPGTPYWPSTPTGGSLPFHVGEGLAHYYGVGAYKRPLDDVRLAGVKFTPECLGFSNVPESPNLQGLTPAGAPPPHHPAWKAGVPRDSGTGWDFEDVRDHYLKLLYAVDPVQLRSEDLPRYLELSRLVSGEVMERVFSEWRRGDDPCGGALTWFLNDLRPGAGWGLVDSTGNPKTVLYYLRRAWAPRCVRLLDRGLDGLVALLVNEVAEPLDAEIEFLAIGRGGAVITTTRRQSQVPPRSSLEMAVENAFGHFVDSSYSYRFGPPRYEAIVVRLLVNGGESMVSEDVYRVDRTRVTPASAMDAQVQRGPGGALSVTLATDTTLYDIRLDVRDYRATDSHFCLTPGQRVVLQLHKTAGKAARSFQGYVEASNLQEAVRLVVVD
jgi:beta-mannosidase